MTTQHFQVSVNIKKSGFAALCTYRCYKAYDVACDKGIVLNFKTFLFGTEYLTPFYKTMNFIPRSIGNQNPVWRQYPPGKLVINFPHREINLGCQMA